MFSIDCLSSENFLEYRDYVKKSWSFAVTGLTSVLRLLLVKSALEYSKKKVLFVTSTEQNALKFQNDFNKNTVCRILFPSL